MKAMPTTTVGNPPPKDVRSRFADWVGVFGLQESRPGSRTVPWNNMRAPPEKGWFGALNQEQLRGGATDGSWRGTSGEGR